jgi:hypothetical protein
MKSFRSILFWPAAFSAAILASVSCYGHDGPVHEKITESAFWSSSSLQSFLTENLGSVNYPLTAFPSAIGGEGEKWGRARMSPLAVNVKPRTGQNPPIW